MADETADLSPKQYKAIAALLSKPTIAGAAAEANVGERTLYTWLADPAFDQAYRAARRAAVAHAVAQLQRYAEVAAKELGALVSGLGGVKAEIRLAAARTILEMAIKSIDLDDVQDRLSRLEDLYGQKP